MYKLTLYETDYVRIDGDFKTVRTKHGFNCPTLIDLLDLITDMVKTTDAELEFTIFTEEDRDNG